MRLITSLFNERHFPKQRFAPFAPNEMRAEMYHSERMRLLLGYDGSSYADAALDDLRRGLPRDVEALVVSVGHAAIDGPLARDRRNSFPASDSPGWLLGVDRPLEEKEPTDDSSSSGD